MALAGLWLVGSAFALRSASPQRLAYQAALAALMLAVMSVPLGPLDYHMSLVGVVGVLLGPAGAFQAALIVSAILALFGHGGITVIGLNALVLGGGAAVAHPAFRLLPERWSPGVRAALATVAAQAVSGALLLLVVAAASPVSDTRAGRGTALFAALSFPLWVFGTLLEAGVALGIVRFLSRVMPRLLPARPGAHS